MRHVSRWLRIVVMLLNGCKVLLIACFVGAAAPDRAVSQPRDIAGTDFAGNLILQSPELVGDKWGWRLIRYKDVMNSYNLNGELLLRLSTELAATDNVIWDPLTGQGRHLDHNDYILFGEEHGKDLIRGWLELGRVLPILGGRTIKALPAPGVGSTKCTPIYYQFFRVRDASGTVLRSFYVVEKIDHPKTKKYHLCIPGDGGVPINPKLDFQHFSSAWPSGHDPEDIFVGDES